MQTDVVSVNVIGTSQLRELMMHVSFVAVPFSHSVFYMQYSDQNVK